MKKDHAPVVVWSLVVKQKSAGPLERVSALAACYKGATSWKRSLGCFLLEQGLRHKARAVDMETNCLYCSTSP